MKITFISKNKKKVWFFYIFFILRNTSLKEEHQKIPKLSTQYFQKLFLKIVFKKLLKNNFKK